MRTLRVAKLVECPKCRKMVDFQQALINRECPFCGARFPRAGNLKIKHDYIQVP